jgi:hypothetical protein
LGTEKLFLFSLGDFARTVLGRLLVTYMLKFFNVTEFSGLPLLLPSAPVGTLQLFRRGDRPVDRFHLGQAEKASAYLLCAGRRDCRCFLRDVHRRDK